VSGNQSEADAHCAALRGRRILITRAAHQASQLADRLSALGATAIVIPTIEIAAPASYAALDDALSRLSEFDLVAFTSANAVEVFRQRAQILGITPEPRRIAVVGPATERAVVAIGLRADLIAPAFTAESLAQSIIETILPEVPDARILLVLVEKAPETLRSAVAAAGASVMVAAAYSNRIPQDSLAAIEELFANPEKVPDAVTFTSASTAENLLALLQGVGQTLPASVVRASIGPITTRALCELGLPPHLEASEPTLHALVCALADHFKKMQTSG